MDEELLNLARKAADRGIITAPPNAVPPNSSKATLP
jgi:hypothetical protein